jgi:hypothetical protein
MKSWSKRKRCTQASLLNAFTVEGVETVRNKRVRSLEQRARWTALAAISVSSNNSLSMTTESRWNGDGSAIHLPLFDNFGVNYEKSSAATMSKVLRLRKHISYLNFLVKILVDTGNSTPNFYLRNLSNVNRLLYNVSTTTAVFV